MKVQQILTNAIYDSLQDRKFEKIVDGGYLLAALNHLNNILDEWKDLIPYASSATFTNVENLENTTFVEVDSVAFVINRSSNILTSRTLSEFREIQDVIGLVGYPESYYFDQLNQTLEVYPKPSTFPYQFIVDGRISVVDLGQFDDVPARLTRFMQTALTYEIAFRLSADYGAEWDGKKESLRTGTFQSLRNKKSIDLRPKSESVFGLPNTRNTAPFPTWYYMSGGT
jgi:hypothetical protein